MFFCVGLFCMKLHFSVFSITFKVSLGDINFVNTLVGKDIIEIVTSLFDEKEDEKIQV